jgi:hypothetical protein
MNLKINTIQILISVIDRLQIFDEHPKPLIAPAGFGKTHTINTRLLKLPLIQRNN